MKPLPRIACAALLTTLSVAAASAQIAFVGELSNDRQASPGDSYEGSFTLRNDSNEPAEAKIYQTDYSFSCDGTTEYGEPGRLARSNARWIEFRPDRPVVPPHGSTVVQYSVKVPRSAGSDSLKGCYWSMLMVEEVATGSPESSIPTSDRKGMGLQQTIRYGIQIATHITGTGATSVQFSDPALTQADSAGKALRISITNTGDTWMRPDVYVEVFDAAGKSHGRTEGTRFRMYPGTCVRQELKLPSLPPGEYTALVVVDAGGEQAFGAQYTVTL
jgi:hypothetical protein